MARPKGVPRAGGGAASDSGIVRGEVRGRGGTIEFTKVLAERKGFLSRRKLVYRAMVQMDEKKREVHLSESLTKTGSGLAPESGFEFKRETYRTKRGSREGNIAEQSKLFGKTYSYTFDFASARSAIERLAQDHGYAIHSIPSIIEIGGSAWNKFFSRRSICLDPLCLTFQHCSGIASGRMALSSVWTQLIRAHIREVIIKAATAGSAMPPRRVLDRSGSGSSGTATITTPTIPAAIVVSTLSNPYHPARLTSEARSPLLGP